MKEINKKYEFDPVLANKKFQILTAPYNPRDDQEYTDYNNCVDDILNICPPYHTNAQYNPSYQSQTGSQLDIIKKRVKTIPFKASPHQINWGEENELTKHKVDIFLSNSQNIKNKTEEEKVTRGPPRDLATRIQSSLNNFNQSLKADVGNKSQDIEVSMFRASVGNGVNGRGNMTNKLNSQDLNNDSIFGSNANNTQNFLRDSRLTKPIVKDSQKNFSEPSFSMAENDDKSDLNFLAINGASQNASYKLKNTFKMTQKGEHVVKITAKDLSNLEEVNEELELSSPKNFRQNSKNKDPFGGHLEEDLDNVDIEALFNKEQTPALFRGTSGVIDPQTLKRK
eukprot:CAMPEP_0197017000 /NCGR_PEP_ID=MMETSP1380-20130617/79294_1 /TAXON_ID=5936 /ORGANISM="Euplotes crassus, Strain CT5" /LENGTH=338 /DNA_ID=CAMNT_0042444043 /DNA_START=542 /DNA_END=1558 /DNA_ORIENTATION=-